MTINPSDLRWWPVETSDIHVPPEYLAFLDSLQTEAHEVEVDRGFDAESIQQKALILAEEVFEVLKVLRFRSGVATSVTSGQPSRLEDELADLTFVTAAIANRVPVKLGESVTECMADKEWMSLKVSSSSETARDRAPSLQLALTLASEVLTVIQATQEISGSTLESRISLGIDDSQYLKHSLARIALLAGIIAANDSIDLGEAMYRKLNRDQLRLWSVIDCTEA